LAFFRTPAPKNYQENLPRLEGAQVVFKQHWLPLRNFRILYPISSEEFEEPEDIFAGVFRVRVIRVRTYSLPNETAGLK
jgi:hypothetical protein